MVREADDFEDASVSADTDGASAPWAYEMQVLGYNYRLSDIHAALGASQLKKLAAFKAHRRALLRAYDSALAPLAPIAGPVPMSDGACPHLMVALIDFETAGVTRGEIMRRLRDDGIGAQVHYIPVHRQPYYSALCGAQTLPGAEAYYARCLSLPLFAAMDESDVARVAEALSAALGL
jgi:dTDP-4-amino-4,6-dideoxygalactose transaminase